MIQADKDTMIHWCGLMSRDVMDFADVLDADTNLTAYVENVAYGFANLAMRNLVTVAPDDESLAPLTLHAAQGLMRGASEALALIKPEHLFVDDKRKN